MRATLCEGDRFSSQNGIFIYSHVEFDTHNSDLIQFPNTCPDFGDSETHPEPQLTNTFMSGSSPTPDMENKETNTSEM